MECTDRWERACWFSWLSLWYDYKRKNQQYNKILVLAYSLCYDFANCMQHRIIWVVKPYLFLLLSKIMNFPDQISHKNVLINTHIFIFTLRW